MMNTLDMDIWSRVMQLDGQELSPEKARLVLSFRIPSADREKVDELGRKSNSGELTEVERAEYEAYVRVMDLLAILQARARLALQKIGLSA